MTKRRERGEGSLYWDSSRERWIAEVTVGWMSNGKRRTRKTSGKTKTEAKEKLRELIRDLDDGLPAESPNYRVADAVEAWLTYGLPGRSPETVQNYRNLASVHIVPGLGKRRLRDLSAEDVDKWLADVATRVSTRTVRLLHSLLNRAVKHAQARDKVRRNVVALCDVPTGLEGRPSKSLTLEQAEAVLDAAESWPRMHAYVVLSLLVGARTEELRALRWEHVDLVGGPTAGTAAPRSISVWRSVREGGDTKTKRSRRTLALPLRAAVALRLHRLRFGRDAAPEALVFATRNGTELDAHNVRRDFRKVVRRAGLTPGEWTPRELRHSFVSLLSDNGVSLERIARLCGHSGTGVTEQVYRHQIRPVMEEAARAMDDIFARKPRE
ncbi:tyrosine-type recombinase/integrase [Prauserella alba]|uniref:Site-specific integrase n=1 Tax=Prauserella alba TaxID=176898 RepID=A0ABN1VF62_9PSEU|nr:tyrosine-type recombinase/integrase [Prauserella alba]MCP2180041.1 Site-specific recombinase XerD [Prauserella alba]